MIIHASHGHFYLLHITCHRLHTTLISRPYMTLGRKKNTSPLLASRRPPATRSSILLMLPIDTSLVTSKQYSELWIVTKPNWQSFIWQIFCNFLEKNNTFFEFYTQPSPIHDAIIKRNCRGKGENRSFLHWQDFHSVFTTAQVNLLIQYVTI
jgi:hypothetical protein